MKHTTVCMMLAALLAAGGANAATKPKMPEADKPAPVPEGPVKLTREEISDMLRSARGLYWSIDETRDYVIIWNRDGTLALRDPKAKLEDDPVTVGEWSIKSVKPEEDEKPESVAARNQQLRHVYCQRLATQSENRPPDCFDVYQVSFLTEKDSKKPSPTQRCKLYREGGGETRKITITRGS